MTSTSRRGKKTDSVKRRYLPSSERKREILDAAFEEFSRWGFLATSLERIAARAEISKSGIYAHYASKDAIFEDMLIMALVPQDSHSSLLEPDTTDLSEILDRYLDRMYATLDSQQAIATFRLLIAESGRSPDFVQRWGRKLLEHSLVGDRSFLDACTERDIIRPGVSLDQYLLTGAPSVLWLVLMTLFGAEDNPILLQQVRPLHKRLLLELLQPEEIA